MKRELKVTKIIEVEFDFPHFIAINNDLWVVAYLSDENCIVVENSHSGLSVRSCLFERCSDYLTYEHEVITKSQFMDKFKNASSTIKNSLNEVRQV